MGLAPGSRLGQYEILAPLGAGGMGEVYRARDARLGREVALKVLPGGVAADPSRLARFEREARLLAALNHPGIAAVYGFEDHGDTPFIIMELVPGETLSERLTGGPLPLREALQLARQIAEALESAHERGVVHRDLKPGNIKVTPEGKVKVLDLGLAKAFDVKSSSSEDMSQSPTLEQTRPGVILGTAEFMSPEQARGKPVDKRSDIWAFGCVVYEMLAGRRAFTGETVSDVLAAILSTEPDWRALPVHTPPAVRELLARCLRKDQNRRLRDIGEGRIAIEEAIAGLDGPPRLSRPERSRWNRAALIVLPILLLAALAGWYVLRARDPRADSMAASASAGIPQRKYLAVLPFKELSRRPDGQLIGDGFAETVSVRIAKIPGVQVVPPASATAAAGRHADPYEVAKALRANLLVHGAVQQEGEQVRVTFFVNNAGDRTQIMADGITGPAGDLFALQDRVAEKIAGSLNLPQPPAAGPTGLDGADQRSYLKAVGLLQRYEKQSSVEEAVRILESVGGSSARTAIIPATLGRAYLLLYDLTKDRVWTDRAIAACEAASRLDPELPEVHVTLGALYNRTGKADDAVAEFERALKLQPSNADALIGLGDAHRAAGRFAEAVTSYRSAIGSQPGYWGGYSKLGALYFQRAQYDKAAEQFQEVIALTPDNSRAFQNLGSVYLFLERMDDARAAYEKALALQPTSVGYSNLGTLEFYVGNYPAAARHFEKAVEATPGNYQLWANLGDAYRWAPGMRPRARAAYQKAVAVVREALAVNPNDAAVHANLAAVYAKMGDPEEASRQISRALQLDPRSTQTMYKAAVVAAVAGRRREAVDWIQQALNAGYSRSQIQRDPEFAAFHDDPAFREALKEVS